MTIPILIWVSVIVLAILALDLARAPVRRFLLASATFLARITCSLRAQMVKLRDGVGRWHSTHLLRLEAEQISGAIDVLERDFARTIGHDLAQVPDLRQHTHDVLRDLHAAYAREERGLTDEPAWVQRLEMLAQTPPGDRAQSQRLARDMQETVLRIARLALEEHRQNMRSLLAARRRIQDPLGALVARLAALQERLIGLQSKAESLDHGLRRFEQNRTQRSLKLPVHARAGGQWLLSTAGLALAALAVFVYQGVFGDTFELLFSGGDGARDISRYAVWAVLGGAALSGWILIETRADRAAGITAINRLGSVSRGLMTASAGLVLLAIVSVSMANGYLRDEFLYRSELLLLPMAGGDGALDHQANWTGQMLGGLLGLVLPLSVAFAPFWVIGLLDASRVLLGALLWLLLALLAGVLQWLAQGSFQLRRWLPAAFDLIIFAPEAFRRWRRRVVA